MTRRLTEREQVDIIHAYTVDLEPMISIASRYERTRQAIYKVLKKAKVDTTKHKILVSCDCCQEEIFRHKCVVRNRTHIFCSRGCFSAWLEASQQGVSVTWRQGQRIARKKVGEAFDLSEGHVVHHQDRNHYNNRLDNLRVFRNSGDHSRFHRLGSDYVQPIWDGSCF